LVVEHFNRLVGFVGRAHFNKGKSARAAREFIEHQLAFDDGSSLLEELFEVAFGGAIGKVSHIQSCFHFFSLCHPAPSCPSRLVRLAGHPVMPATIHKGLLDELAETIGFVFR
jgi:hypothetical protein